jgi:hypothetical protein
MLPVSLKPPSKSYRANCEELFDSGTLSFYKLTNSLTIGAPIFNARASDLIKCAYISILTDCVNILVILAEQKIMF